LAAVAAVILGVSGNGGGRGGYIMVTTTTLQIILKGHNECR
jgi:hypothetical protein